MARLVTLSACATAFAGIMVFGARAMSETSTKVDAGTGFSRRSCRAILRGEIEFSGTCEVVRQDSDAGRDGSTSWLVSIDTPYSLNAGSIPVIAGVGITHAGVPKSGPLPPSRTSVVAFAAIGGLRWGTLTDAGALKTQLVLVGDAGSDLQLHGAVEATLVPRPPPAPGQAFGTRDIMLSISF